MAVVDYRDGDVRSVPVPWESAPERGSLVAETTTQHFSASAPSLLMGGPATDLTRPSASATVSRTHGTEVAPALGDHVPRTSAVGLPSAQRRLDSSPATAASGRRHGQDRRVRLAVGDVLALALAAMALLGIGFPVPVVLLSTLGAAIMLAVVGAWRAAGTATSLAQAKRLAVAGTGTLTVGVLLGLGAVEASPRVLVPAVLIAFALVTLGRCLAGVAGASAARRGVGLARTLVVGQLRDARVVAQRLRHDKQADVVGVVVLPATLDHRQGPKAQRELIDALGAMATLSKAERLLVTGDLPGGADDVRELTRHLDREGISLSLVPSLHGVSLSRVTVSGAQDMPMLDVRASAGRRGASAVGKRVFDLVLSSLVLTAFSPVWLIVSAMIRLESKGPAIYRQERIGRDGVPFVMWKFRSMSQDADVQRDALVQANEGAGPLFKMVSDPRVTRIGRFIRKTSLDEMPQLVNVVRGEMSLVGPRPALAHEVADYDHVMLRRLRVKPGLTGPWQVSGRSDLNWEQSRWLDTGYAENWSLVRDVSLLFKTVGAVALRRGAY